MEGMIGEIFFGGTSAVELESQWRAFLENDARSDTRSDTQETEDAFEFDFAGTVPEQPRIEDGEIVLKAVNMLDAVDPEPSAPTDPGLDLNALMTVGVEPDEIDVF